VLLDEHQRLIFALGRRHIPLAWRTAALVGAVSAQPVEQRRQRRVFVEGLDSDVKI
jgi:hypothetical protein